MHGAQRRLLASGCSTYLGSTGIDGKRTDPDSPVGHGHERATLERSCSIAEDRCQCIVHTCWRHVGEAKGHDARHGVAAQGDDSPKVEIVSDDGPLLIFRLDDNLVVRQALQTLIPEVDGVVAQRS